MTLKSNSIAALFQTLEYGPAPEAEDEVRAWLARHEAGFDLFINGAWVKPEVPRARFESRNPARDEHLAWIAAAGPGDVDAAVRAAGAAFPAWAATPGHQRARVLYALSRLVQKYTRFFAVLESLDTGKPLRETRDIDLPLVARHFSYHAGWAQLLSRELPGHAPLGVCGQIIPWNFPLLMLSWKVAPAIAAGNCVVVKPAEQTCLSALFFASLCAQAGVPPGVINIVTGDGATGAALVAHPGIAKIAFTGSTEVGRAIRAETAGSGKKLSLELGGKSAFLVFEDADIDSAVEGLVDAIFLNQGQVCCAGSRLLVEEGAALGLLDKLKTRLQSFRLGDPLDKGVDMGAVIDRTQQDRIAALVDRGVAEGASLWRPAIALPAQGCFYPPTLLTDIAPSNSAAIEEIFGPVLTVMTFRHRAEAVALANSSRYGLSATIWCESIDRALSVASELKAGTVWINTTNMFDAACGFGGYRESGFGREGGLEGLLEYLQPTDDFPPPAETAAPASAPQESGPPAAIDRTPKLYIGAKQVRADNGGVRAALTADGRLAGHVGDGRRKDVRDAVEAAVAAAGWSRATAHNRAQVLFFLAENLSARREEFARRLSDLTGAGAGEAEREVETSLERLFAYAGWADKFDGAVHTPPIRGVTLAVPEPLGVLGIVCPDEAPLLALVSLMAPAIALGNTCVIAASERYPLPATDFYQVLDTSDVPAGVVNILTGPRTELAETLARHDQVDGLWYFATAEGAARVEALSVGNLKRTWTNQGRARDWFSNTRGEGRAFLREASQVKNIWLPFSE